MNGDQHRDTTPQESGGKLLASRYRLDAVLGEGGMGTVWRATDEFLRREVAVKELRFAAGVDEDEQQRLVARTLTEAKAIARIRHNGAVTVYDVVEEDGRPWIVMELVESRSLSEVIRKDGVLPPQRAAEVALELLGVLAEAHRVGILHRDVKPSNVLIGHDGRVVLTDFGIARVEGDPSVTSTGMLVGAPSYISPERARGGVPGPPADLWSLGATLYAMVEGVPPYDKGSALSTLTAVITEPVPPLTGDRLLQPVISGLLRKDPAERLDAPKTRTMLRGVIGEYERRARATVQLGAAAETSTQAVPAPERTRVQGAVPSPAPSAEEPGAGAGAGTGVSVGADEGAPGSAADGEAASAAVLSPGARGGSGGVGGSGGSGGVTTTYSAGSGLTGPRRRALLIAAIVVAAVLLVAATVAALSDNGSQGHGKSGTSQDGASSSARAGAPDGQSGGSPAPGTGAGTGTEPAPAGAYHRVAGPGGSTLEIPTSWRQTSTSDTKATFTGAAGVLVVEFTPHPVKAGALKAWQDEEPRVAPTLAGYHLIRLNQVAGWHGWDAADWEWTFRSGAAVRHSLNRGFVVDPSHAYAIYWTAPESTWQSGRSAALLGHFFGSFEPAGG
ncbi:serine/threonine-protein kinase [Streptacidiphilus pinicola]|nr:serine/threonine-protein kinase [Streptacidiphilus pinicola]